MKHQAHKTSDFIFIPIFPLIACFHRLKLQKFCKTGITSIE